MRITLAVAVACLTFGGLAAAGDATAAIRKSTDIPAQGLGPALTKLAKEFDFQVLYRTEIVSNLKSPGAMGALTSEEALGKVLTGTGLTYKYLDDKTVTIVPMSTAGSGQSTPQNAAGSADDAGTSKEAGKLNSQGFRVAQVDQGKTSNPSSVREQSSSSRGNSTGQSVGLEEIVVTAQKRSEKLLDVPTSITAISGARLESLQVQSLSDLAGYVPGLNVTSGGAPGFRTITLRGINDSFDATTPSLVGTYLDNTPVGSSTGANRGAFLGLDLMPYDIEGVEVLQGPQGTLYGSNAMGGIIKYVLRKPDLTQFDARAGTYVEDTKGTDSPNWGVRGAANLPIATDILALRLSGFSQGSAGWIDNVGTGMKNVNDSKEEGGRAALLWQATDRLAIQTTVLYQDSHASNWTDVALNRLTSKPPFGSNTTYTNFPEPFSQRTALGSVDINWDLGFATLTSTSTWSNLVSHWDLDVSALAVYYIPYPNALMQYNQHDRLDKFVQEVRLTSPETQRLHWMLGGFYTKEDTTEDSAWPTYTPDHVLLPEKDFLFISAPGNDRNTFREKAAFGNLSYNITDRFEVGAGERYSWDSQYNCGLIGTGIVAPVPPVPCTTLPAQGVSTWMANASFHLNRDLMLYTRVATGYRPGSGCPTCFNVFAPQAPPIIKPDKTTDYELGIKGDLLNNRIQFSLSAYTIDWTDIQVSVNAPNGAFYPTNAGGARSNGFEGSVAFEVARGLRLTATLAYTDAYLTVTDSHIGATKGDQLPTSPRWAASLVADYTRPLRDGLTLTFGGDYRYRDVVFGDFPGGAFGSIPLPPQNIVGAYAGLQLSRIDLRLYAKNVFNNLTYAGLIPSLGTYQEAVPVQPRTIGLSADYRF